MEEILNLFELIEKQNKLNDIVFKKQDLRNTFGVGLTSDYLRKMGNQEVIGPNSDVNTWLKKFSWAMKDEQRELDEELLEKWWSKDTLDMQNIRVELIDQLHFLLSLFNVAGMDGEDVSRIYNQKYQVNIDRQKQGYSRETKTETDNENLK